MVLEDPVCSYLAPVLRQNVMVGGVDCRRSPYSEVDGKQREKERSRHGVLVYNL